MTEAIPSFFNTAERQFALMGIAAAWEGTPFFPNSEARGKDGGVDCVRLLHGVYVAAGVMSPIEIPPQVMDHGQHSECSVLEEAFDTWPGLATRFRRLPDCLPANILPGDALLFVAGKVPHHAGVMLPARDVLHTIAPAGVHRVRLTAMIRGERLLGRLSAVYRPLPC